MALNGAQNRHFVVLDGKTLTSGGSLNVTDGVLAIVDNKNVTATGRKVLSSFSGLPKDKDFQILLGKQNHPVTRSTNNKPYETLPFKLSEVEKLEVVAPKQVGQKVDDFIIGYNGKAGTEIILGERTASEIEITLCGEPMYHLGYADGKVSLKLMLEYPYLDADGVAIDAASITMQEIVEKAVERFNRMTLIGGAPVTDYVEAIVVNSENESLDNTTSFTFYTLTLEDKGDKTALARVQAQYPTYKVVQSRDNDTSTYTILAPTGTSLADYTKSLAQLIKGCEDCPSGYSELEAGVVYSVEIEDDGADLTTTVDDLPGFVSGSVVKVSQIGGVGVYTVVVDAELTDAEIATFKAASAAKATSTITLVGDVQSLCENTTTTTTAWVAGEACTAISKNFRITLPDDTCSGNRLAELQAAYPNLTIALDTPNLSQTVTLTGSSGTANVTIGGVNYLATYDTNLNTTVANFISTHEAAIELATGGTLTSTGATITLVDAVEGFPSITVTNVSGNLAGTVAARVASGSTVAGLCQTTYRTSVLTNIVCTECSPEFRALFSAEAPKNFGMYSWTGQDTTYSETAKMGIRFRGKEFIIAGDEVYRDEVPFVYTSTRLSVAGGQPEFIAESWENVGAPFALKILSIASPAEALGGHLWEAEDQSRVYFDGLPRFEGNNFGKWMWGQETRLKPTAQYVDYQLTVHPKKYFQLLPHASEKITYHFIVEVGRHEAVETLLNSLATASGLPAVQAFAK